ncbi:MAG: hypothetical protein Q8P39_02040 [Candidatus Yanofskybacteria bacterium]|nr:hypothetical protein [Candidatus Yanofskybacteria bacterium]
MTLLLIILALGAVGGGVWYMTKKKGAGQAPSPMMSSKPSAPQTPPSNPQQPMGGSGM